MKFSFHNSPALRPMHCTSSIHDVNCIQITVSQKVLSFTRNRQMINKHPYKRGIRALGANLLTSFLPYALILEVPTKFENYEKKNSANHSQFPFVIMLLLLPFRRSSWESNYYVTWNWNLHERILTVELERERDWRIGEYKLFKFFKWICTWIHNFNYQQWAMFRHIHARTQSYNIAYMHAQTYGCLLLNHQIELNERKMRSGNLTVSFLFLCF